MVIGSRVGHSPNCLGAVYLRNEYECMKVLEHEVTKILVENGHTVIDCSSNANTQIGELSEGVRKANAQYLDVFISYHMNASNKHLGHGTECWLHPNCRESIKEMATRITQNLSALGFYNRGLKYGMMYEMRNINAPNIIIETCFCDNEKDVAIWSPTPYEVMARAIANAIDPNIPLEKEQEYYRVCVQRFKSKEEADNAQEKITNQLGLYCFTEKM